MGFEEDKEEASREEGHNSWAFKRGVDWGVDYHDNNPKDSTCISCLLEIEKRKSQILIHALDDLCGWRKYTDNNETHYSRTAKKALERYKDFK